MKASLVEAGSAFRASHLAVAAAVTLGFRAAEGFLARARGLIGRPPPLPGCGLLLPGVSAVHGFGMRHRIDLVFFDSHGVILAVAPLAPATVVRCSRACQVLEMRDGEIARLALRPGLRPLLLPLDDIFGTGVTACDQSPADDPARRTGGGRSTLWALGMAVGGMMVHGPSSPAEPPGRFSPGVAEGQYPAGAYASPGKRPRAQAGSDIAPAGGRPLGAPAVSAQTLRLLEAEAELLYQEGRQDTSDGELIEIYEALAELAADRSPHAWLRIGNIRQRGGGVGEAIDAYRRVRAPAGGPQVMSGAAAGVVAGAVARTAAKEGASPLAGKAAAAGSGEGSVASALAAERKALQNLAVLALDQARQALARLAALPAPGHDSSGLGEPASGAQGGNPGPAGRPVAVDAYQRQLELLERNLVGQQRDLVGQQQRQPTAPVDKPLDSGRDGPHVVERYTASARRNALKAAKGSLHVDPADELLAGPVPKPRVSRDDQLPRVEYLLGDPLRSRQSADGPDGGGHAGARTARSTKPKAAPATANDQDSGMLDGQHSRRGASSGPAGLQK